MKRGGLLSNDARRLKTDSPEETLNAGVLQEVLKVTLASLHGRLNGAAHVLQRVTYGPDRPPLSAVLEWTVVTRDILQGRGRQALTPSSRPLDRLPPEHAQYNSQRRLLQQSDIQVDAEQLDRRQVPAEVSPCNSLPSRARRRTPPSQRSSPPCPLWGEGRRAGSQEAMVVAAPPRQEGTCREASRSALVTSTRSAVAAGSRPVPAPARAVGQRFGEECVLAGAAPGPACAGHLGGEEHPRSERVWRNDHSDPMTYRWTGVAFNHISAETISN